MRTPTKKSLGCRKHHTEPHTHARTLNNCFGDSFHQDRLEQHHGHSNEHLQPDPLRMGSADE